MNELKRVQEQIKLITQEEKPIKRLLFSFVDYFELKKNTGKTIFFDDLLSDFLLELKKQEKELLPKSKFKQIQLL